MAVVFQVIDRKIWLVEIEQREVLAFADTLESKVVNREDRQRAPEPGAQRVVGAHRDRRGGGMPIVRMDDVRRDNLGGCERGGAAKKSKAADVVEIVDAVLAVDSAPPEKSAMVDEVHRHAMLIGGAQHRETFDAGAEAHRDIADGRRGLDALDDRSVAGNNQRRLLACRLQSAGQRTDHVGEAAGLCMGRGFRRNDRYLHGIKSAKRKDSRGSSRIVVESS